MITLLAGCCKNNPPIILVIAMIGKPKYRRNQNVSFVLGDKTIQGKIAIVDKFGTFEQHNEVSYDIFCADEDCLYKHIPEPMITAIKRKH